MMESNLCTAVAEFWPALHAAGHSTYDDVFLQYGDEDFLESVPVSRLLPMKHLLIDEFQDISGQIVHWIKGVHSVLSKLGEEPSLMVVGDDFQSVYAWRGSHPEFIVHFDKHFGKSQLVVMNENYRCGQHIIDISEKLVQALSESAVSKHGVASGKAALDSGDVKVSSAGDDDIFELVQRLQKSDPGGSIFIISRTNEGLLPFTKLPRSGTVSLMTMHRSKGLEADYVIIKGDCYYNSSSPLKNAIYLQAELMSSYDTTQKDESLRLAYVSLTRARKKAFWFGDGAQPDGVFRLLSEYVAQAANTESGFTLLEVIVSLTIASLIVFGTIGFFTGPIKDYEITEITMKTCDQMRNIDMLAQEFRESTKKKITCFRGTESGGSRETALVDAGYLKSVPLPPPQAVLYPGTDVYAIDSRSYSVWRTPLVDTVVKLTDVTEEVCRKVNDMYAHVPGDSSIPTEITRKFDMQCYKVGSSNVIVNPIYLD